MMMRRLVLASLLVFAASLSSHAFTPDLHRWQKASANGSRVIDTGRGRATFVILRRSRAPKTDVLSHGYAYVLSGPIDLPDGWRLVEISGEWWRLPFRRSNYPELALRVFARYPRLAHGDALYGARETNFIHIGYASWKSHAHYADIGATLNLHGTAAADFPQRPRGFRLAISRSRDGTVSWSFFQRDTSGVWRRLFHVPRSALFAGVNGPRRIFVRIGGWNTWEYPISNRLRVRDLRIEISSWSEPEDGGPDNDELDRRSEELSRRNLREKYRRKGWNDNRSDHGLASEERMEGADGCPAAPFVHNAMQQRRYSGLQMALDAASPGDRIELGCGFYHGHFVIRRRVTLIGIGEGPPPVLDGNGRGVVLRIAAAGTVVRNLAVRHSGHVDDAYAFWQAAGILVEADDVRLQSLQVAENGSGIVLAKTRGGLVEDTRLTDNRSAGLVLIGARGAVVRNNRMSGNELGIVVTTHYPHAERLSTLLRGISWKDVRRYTRTLREINTIIRARTIASHNEMSGNAIFDNGYAGIALGAEVHHNRIIGNHVATTARTRKPNLNDASVTLLMQVGENLQFDAESLRALRQDMQRIAGSGIILTCGAHHNEMRGNVVEDNTSYGVLLSAVHDDLVRANHLRRNRAGILIEDGSKGEQVLENRLTNNRDVGVSIGNYERLRLAAWPTDNLVARNDISGNGHGDVFMDAYDASTTVLGERQIRELVREAPWPAQVKRMFLRKGPRHRKMLEVRRRAMKPGHNRWDDGRLGNHYSVFDEPAEGFLDEDGDGISERAYNIPGGKAIDHHPLSAQRVRQLLQ